MVACCVASTPWHGHRVPPYCPTKVIARGSCVHHIEPVTPPPSTCVPLLYHCCCCCCCCHRRSMAPAWALRPLPSSFPATPACCQTWTLSTHQHPCCIRSVLPQAHGCRHCPLTWSPTCRTLHWPWRTTHTVCAKGGGGEGCFTTGGLLLSRGLLSRGCI